MFRISNDEAHIHPGVDGAADSDKNHAIAVKKIPNDRRLTT
jgi:hypothetical protein